MPCWTEILQAEEECGGCTRPVGPGLAAISNELGKRRSAVCPPCLAGLHPKLAAELAAPVVALLEKDSTVRSVAALLEVVATECREVLAFELDQLSGSPAASAAVDDLTAACEATPQTFEAVLTKAADDLAQLELCPRGSGQEEVLLGANIAALFTVARMRAVRIEAAYLKPGLDKMGLLAAIGRYTRLLAILYNLTYRVAIHARPA